MLIKDWVLYFAYLRENHFNLENTKNKDILLSIIQNRQLIYSTIARL